jgi:integrase
MFTLVASGRKSQPFRLALRPQASICVHRQLKILLQWCCNERLEDANGNMTTETASKSTKKAQALTAKAIEALQPDAIAYRVPDLRCRGLAIRVATDGGKTWSLAFRIKGAGVRRLSRGRFEDVGLEAARQRANALTSAARKGRDLVAEEEAARDEHNQSFTVERLIDEYAKRRLKGRLRTATHIERRIRRALASVMKRKALDMRRRDLRQLFDKVADRGCEAEAEKRRAAVQAMFRWALRQDIVEVDPSAGLGVYGHASARERVLDHDEIRALWSWLEPANLPSHIAHILKLQLCLGARVGELCGLMAEELQQDGSRLLWSLPAARSKNGSGRITPIVGLAKEIIEARLKAAGEDGLLFVSVSGTNPHTNNVGQAIACRRGRSPIPHFTSHDLRRTVATEMAKLELPLETVAAVLGHEAGGAETRTLRKHYLHDSFIDRKVLALAKWDRQLRALLASEGEKVVAFEYNRTHTENVRG